MAGDHRSLTRVWNRFPSASPPPAYFRAYATSSVLQCDSALETIDLGFKPDRVIALNVDPAANGHSGAETSRILDETLRRSRALPDVKAASLAASTPNGSMALSMSVDVPGYTPKREGADIAEFNFISPDYFKTLGQRLLRGKDFGERDNTNGPRVAIVNEKCELSVNLRSQVGFGSGEELRQQKLAGA